jgi:hypothetical protein
MRKARVKITECLQPLLLLSLLHSFFYSLMALLFGQYFVDPVEIE